MAWVSAFAVRHTTCRHREPTGLSKEMWLSHATAGPVWPMKTMGLL